MNSPAAAPHSRILIPSLALLVITFALTAFSGPAQATAYFGNVDLTAQFPSKIRNQGNTGYCYAEVAADLLSAHDHAFVSASDVIINYLNIIDPLSMAFRSTLLAGRGEFDGGWLAQAVGATARHGACVSPGLEENDSHGLAWAGLFADHASDVGKQQVLSEMKAETQSPKAVFADLKHGFLYSDILKTFTSVSSDQMQATWMATGTALGFLTRMRDLQCQGATVPPENIKIVTYGTGIFLGGLTSLLDVIDAQLTRQNPVGIGIYGYFLEPSASQTIIGSHFSIHEVSVAGREYRNGRWEYLVRNSWGTNCYGYSKNVECSVEHPGYLWIERMELNRNLVQVVYIEP